MANVKVPALLYKMSKASQKAWYKKNNMEMPDEPVERSAAAAKRVKVAPRKASDVKPDSVRAVNTARMAAYMAKGGRAPIGAAGSGGNSVMAGSNMSTVRGIITGIKAGFNPTVSLDPYESERAKKTGPRSLKLKKEEAEQVDEGSKRMSAAVKLQRAFEREKTASDTSRERGKEILAQARAEYAKKQAAKTNEEVEQMDEVDYKKYLKVSQEKRPLKLSAVDAALSAEKEGNPNPARKLRNSRDARKFANAQLAKKAAKARPAQKYPVYVPGRTYVGDSVELDGPVIDENNLKSLKAEDAKMKYIEEKLTAADPASKYIKDFVASENPKFAEKSKKERISMALGAYYAAKGKKNEEIVLEEPKDAADVGEYDYEGDMAKSQLRSIMANSKRMYDMLEDTTNLPEWVQSKITLAEDYIVTASNYMESDMNEEVEQVDEAIRGTIRSLKGIMVRRPADQAERDKLASDITANRKYNKGKKIGRVSGDVRKNAAGMTDAQKLVRTLYDKSGRSNKELGPKKFPYSEEVEQVTEAEGTVAVTPKEKSLAAHHGDKTKITFGDVIKARLKSAAAKKMGK